MKYKTMINQPIKGIVSLLLTALAVNVGWTLLSSAAHAATGDGCTPAPSGLVSWWRAEGDANDAIDGNHGTLQNGATFASGEVGQAFAFDGIDDLVDVPASPAFHLQSAVTLDAWIKPNVYGFDVIAGIHSGYQLNLLPDGKVRFAFPSGAGGSVNRFVDTLSAVPIGSFSHVSATYDSGTGVAGIYFNGVLENTLNTSGLIDIVSKPFQIGGFSDPSFTGGFFNGLIDEVDVFSRALSASEIQAIYNAGSAGKCPPISNNPPIARCQNVTVFAGADCTASASVDNGSFDPDGNPTTITQSPPGPYPLGLTTVTLTVSDDQGASSQCTATVTVRDNTPPTITCPVNVVTTTAPGQCSAVVNYAAPTTSDNCPGATVSCNPPSGSTFPKGTTTAACTATDASGNTAICSFTVTVNDNEKPTITCPANMAVPCSIDLLVPVTFSVTASDNCDPSATVTSTPASGSGFPVGTTAVTSTARDASGNFSSCSFTVTRAPLGFAGFLAPIGGADATGGSFADPLRTFKLKSTIPVKFTASCGGSPALTGLHTLQAIKWSSQTDSDPAIDATPTDAATIGNQFRLVGSEWHFNLDTKATGLSAGIWQLIATLSDGSQHTVWIQLK